MTQLRFKIGDKVLVINPYDAYYSNIGVIYSIEDDILVSDYNYYVLFDKTSNESGRLNPWLYHDDELTFYKE